jgi:hypothetical protein
VGRLKGSAGAWGCQREGLFCLLYCRQLGHFGLAGIASFRKVRVAGESTVSGVTLVVSMVRRLSLLFGLLIGMMWVGEVLFGNLGDTSVFGSARTLHLHAFQIAQCFVAGALAFTILSGFYGAHRTGTVKVAIKVAVWSGLISGVMTLVTLVGMTLLFLNALSQSPSDLAEFARSGDQSISRFLILDALGGGLNHLWIGPGLGLVLGSIGGVLGKNFWRSS